MSDLYFILSFVFTSSLQPSHIPPAENNQEVVTGSVVSGECMHGMIMLSMYTVLVYMCVQYVHCSIVCTMEPF